MIVVGTTLAAYVMDQEDTWASWCRNAEVIKKDCDVHYFAAIEVDGRGIEPFKPLIKRLKEIGGSYFTFMLDDGRTEATTYNRLRHLVMGENVCMDFASATKECSHLLFCAADCEPCNDIIPKLLELNHPITAPYISTYCLKGQSVYDYPFPVMKGMASAACIFIARSVFEVLRWRWLDGVSTDDPCFYEDAKNLLGIETLIRMDIQARHFPLHIGPIETRNHSMEVVRPQY